MVNEFKLAVVHFARPNLMQTCACAWIYCWTKNCGKPGLGLRAAAGCGPLGIWPPGHGGPWATGRGPAFSKTRKIVKIYAN